VVRFWIYFEEPIGFASDNEREQGSQNVGAPVLA